MMQVFRDLERQRTHTHTHTISNRRQVTGRLCDCDVILTAYISLLHQPLALGCIQAVGLHKEPLLKRLLIDLQGQPDIITHRHRHADNYRAMLIRMHDIREYLAQGRRQVSCKHWGSNTEPFRLEVEDPSHPNILAPSLTSTLAL